MTVATLRVPGSVIGDPGDVTVALEIARAFWEKGDQEEAMRWLKRAGEAAGEAGDAPRSASLAQAAAELEAVFKSRGEAASQSAVPAAVGPPPSSSAPGVSGASVAPPASISGTSSPSPSQVPLQALAGPSRPPPSAASEAESTPTSVWDQDGRIRVSVKTSVRDPNLLLVRPLLEGQHPPTGAREGFLVLLQSDVDGPSKSNGGGAE